MPNIPRPADTVEEQLGELRAMITKLEGIGVVDFASQMDLQSMRNEEQLLIDEVAAARLLASKNVVQVTFEGTPVEGTTVAGHAIRADFLGDFLRHLQDLSNSIGQAIAGRETRRGTIPNSVLDSNRLLLRSVFDGSFGLNFTTPLREEEPALFQNIEGEPVDDLTLRSLDVLYLLLNGAAPFDELTDAVLYPRVRKHYKRLVELLGKHNTTLRFRTQRDPYSATMTARQAQERRQWLDSIRTRYRNLSVQGTLTAASVRLNDFEIQQDGTIYTGKATEHAVAWLKNITLGSLVDAEIRETSIIHSETADIYRTEYLLLDISRADKD